MFPLSQKVSPFLTSKQPSSTTVPFTLPTTTLLCICEQWRLTSSKTITIFFLWTVKTSIYQCFHFLLSIPSGGDCWGLEAKLVGRMCKKCWVRKTIVVCAILTFSKIITHDCWFLLESFFCASKALNLICEIQLFWLWLPLFLSTKIHSVNYRQVEWKSKVQLFNYPT